MYNRQPKVQYNSLEDNDDVASAVPENPSIRGAPSKKEKKIDLVTDKSLNASKRHLAYIADFWDVLSFGICISMGNIFIAWGSGFSSGFWDFFFATALSGSCFICLFLSLAEIISIVPFGGGTYALARVTVGPYIGFLVGCCESVGNIVYAFVAMMPLGTTITYMFNGDPTYEPIYWLVIYLLVIGTEFAGRKVYFTFLRCVAFISLAIIGLYVIVSIQDIKIDQYIPNIASNTYRGGIKELLPLFYPAGWWYFGIEIMPLMNDEIKNPRVTAPRAMVSATAIVTCLAFVCILLSYAQYPSYQDDYALLLQTLPLNSGFSNAFGINDQMATILSYPGLYISNALFIYGYGKQLSALAKSKLLPSCFGWSLTASNTPYFALLFGSLVGYVVLVVLTKGYGYNYDSELTNELFNAAMMGTYFTFEVMFISYIIFKYKYAKLTRSYTSPLGVYGAIYGAMGFGFLFQSAVLFSEDDYHAFYFFVVFLVLSSIYYFLHAKYSQTFSEEEQSVMFVVYLLKANERKLKVRRIVRKHVQGRNRVAVASETISSETANTDSNVQTSPIPPPAISLVTKHSRGKLTAQTTMTNSNRYLEEDEKTNSDCYQESSIPVDSSSLPAAILEEPEYLPDWISTKAKKKSVKFVLTN